MFCKISRTIIKGKRYYYASLVESFRENDKIKHKLIKNIGSIDYETSLRLKLAFSQKIPIDSLKDMLDSFGIKHE
ncbi:MAG: hypothetical protein RQ856_06240 [Candidatus Izemoplasmatales bacterium]|nr:hypothetical protein [Candidatus Izemoplasmatales bacterium]